MTHSYGTVTVLVIYLLSGCATVNDDRSEFRRQLTLDLKKACIEANGGLQMDTVDLYAGRLSTSCSAWAHRQARQTGR